MKKSIGVITSDSFLYQKIFLSLCDSCDVMRVQKDSGNFDLLLVDIDSASAPDEKCITLSRHTSCDLSIPFTYSGLRDAVLPASSALSLSDDEKCAFLHGKKIKLTELEYNLLSSLYLADGYITRAELLSNLWNESANDGIVNVYIHYLREKLEINGEKIILCSRKYGYKLDEKYRKGGS